MLLNNLEFVVLATDIFFLVLRQVTRIISVCVYFELHTSLLGGFEAYVLRFCVSRQNESRLFTLGFLGLYYVTVLKHAAPIMLDLRQSDIGTGLLQVRQFSHLYQVASAQLN